MCSRFQKCSQKFLKVSKEITVVAQACALRIKVNEHFKLTSLPFFLAEFLLKQTDLF